MIKPALVLQKFYSIKPRTAVVGVRADGFAAKQSPTTPLGAMN